MAFDLSQMRLGTNDKNVAKGVVNSKVATLCTRIKAQNVRLYTITYQLSSSTLQDLFRNCASSPSLYFNSPTNETLQTVFQTIGYDLSNLRISK